MSGMIRSLSILSRRQTMTGFIIYFILTVSSPNPPLFRPKYVDIKDAKCNQNPPLSYTNGSHLLDATTNPTTVYMFSEGNPGVFCKVNIAAEIAKLPPGPYTALTFTLMGTTVPPNVKVGRETVEAFIKK